MSQGSNAGPFDLCEGVYLNPLYFERSIFIEPRMPLYDRDVKAYEKAEIVGGSQAQPIYANPGPESLMDDIARLNSNAKRLEECAERLRNRLGVLLIQRPPAGIAGGELKSSQPRSILSQELRWISNSFDESITKLSALLLDLDLQ